MNADLKTLRNDVMNKTVSIKNPVMFGDKGWRHNSLFLPNQKQVNKKE